MNLLRSIENQQTLNTIPNKNQTTNNEAKGDVSFFPSATKDDKVFTQVENEPRFPGGDAAWRNYLQNNLDATTPVVEGWSKGTHQVIVSFKVNKDGSLEDVKTENFQGSKTADECINLLKKGPKWIPALQNGHVVAAYKKQSITFVVAMQ